MFTTFTIHCPVKLEIHRWGQTVIQHAQQQDVLVECLKKCMLASDVASIGNTLQGTPRPIIHTPLIQTIQAAMHQYKHTESVTHAMLYDPVNGNVELYSLAAMIDRAASVGATEDTDQPVPLIAILTTTTEKLSLHSKPTINVILNPGDILIIRGRTLYQFVLRQLENAAIILFTGTRMQAHCASDKRMTEYYICNGIASKLSAKLQSEKTQRLLELTEFLNQSTHATTHGISFDFTMPDALKPPVEQWVQYVVERMKTLPHTDKMVGTMGVDHMALFRCAFKSTVSEIVAFPRHDGAMRKTLCSVGIRGRPRDRVQDECIRLMETAVNCALEAANLPHILSQAWILRHVRRMLSAERVPRVRTSCGVWTLTPLATTSRVRSVECTARQCVPRTPHMRVVLAEAVIGLAAAESPPLSANEHIFMQRILLMSRQLGFLTIEEHKLQLQLLRCDAAFKMQLLPNSFIWELQQAGATIEYVATENTTNPSTDCDMLVLQAPCFGKNTDEWKDILVATVRKHRLVKGGILLLHQEDASVQWQYRAMLFVRAILLQKYRAEALDTHTNLLAHVQATWAAVSLSVYPINAFCMTVDSIVDTIGYEPDSELCAMFTKSCSPDVTSGQVMYHSIHALNVGISQKPGLQDARE